MQLNERLARRARDREPSPIRELMPLMRKPGMISLGGGYPNPETFALRDISLTFARGGPCTFDHEVVRSASQYGPTPCHPALMEQIPNWHAFKDQVTLAPEQWVMLNGSQEGLFIMAYLFLNEEDVAIVEEPAYPGALSALRSFSRLIAAVPMDEHGLITTELERRLQACRDSSQPMPKFIYCVPNGHNPAGVTMSLERRKHLLSLAGNFDVLILEDDPYQLLQLEDEPSIPSLQSLEGDPKLVVRLDSFSKILAPGLRLGYASGPAEVMRQFVLYKQSANLHTSSLDQVILGRLLGELTPSGFQEHIRGNCAIYRRHRDAMVDAAGRLLPDDVSFNRPRHGMFVWFSMPHGFRAQRMMQLDCANLGVLLVPGSAFSVQSDLSHCMRASYSLVPPTQLEQGIQRLATMVQRERNRIHAT